jgi:hypothetical protein
LPFRHFIIQTTESPSWVSWKEISFHPQDPTSISTELTELPKAFILKQNYPNPFNPETIIEYQIPKKEFVSLQIYDQIGQKIITLVNDVKEAGLHQVKWHGRDKNDRPVASGTYIYQFIASDYKESKKFVLIR